MSATPELYAFRSRLLELCELDDSRLFVIFDAARVHGVRGFLRESRSDFVCLYRGTPETELAHVAPYLARMPLFSVIISWLLVDTVAAASALILVSDAGLEELRTHLRRWLIVLDSTGGENFFRFYDPRVVAPFLGGCTPSEAARFFGPIRAALVCSQAPPVREPLFRVWRAPSIQPVPAPPSALDKFVLRPEHEARFTQDSLERYEHRCVLYLRSQHTKRLAKMSDLEVRQIVIRARQAGQDIGISSGRDVTALAQVLAMGGGAPQLQEIGVRPRHERSKAITDLRDRLLQTDAV